MHVRFHLALPWMNQAGRTDSRRCRDPENSIAVPADGLRWQPMPIRNVSGKAAASRLERVREESVVPTIAHVLPLNQVPAENTTEIVPC